MSRESRMLAGILLMVYGLAESRSAEEFGCVNDLITAARNAGGRW